MQRITLTPQNQTSAIDQAAACLKDGGLVLYPTETVYGVAVDAINTQAVDKLLAYKNRPAGKAVSVLVDSKQAAQKYVELNPEAERLFDTFLPGPLTVVCKDKCVVDPRLSSELGTLGVRISSHPVAMELSRQCGMAITATSANASGRGRAYAIDVILEGLSDRQQGFIGLILDYGILPPKDPSTVIDTTRQTQQLVRSGSYLEKVSPTLVSASEEETVAYAAELMRSFMSVLKEKAVVFVLDGELGAGKTRFAKGVAKALGITRNINSPTFNLMKEYEGPEGIRLLHLDCWRMDEVKPEHIGLDEYLKPGHVVVAEWAHVLLPYLKDNLDKASVCHLLLNHAGETEREISIIKE